MSVHVGQSFPAITTHWPLRSHLELAPIPAAVPSARMHARRVLGKWRLKADSAELIVSELVTNAVRASGAPASPAVGVWLLSYGNRVLVQIWDGCDRIPVLRDPRPDAEDGRGLLIVDSLTADWGSYRRLGGKVVWAVVTGCEVKS